VVGSEAVVDEEAIPFPVNGSNQVRSLFCHLESIGWRGKLSIRGGAIGSDAFRDTVRKCLLTSNPRVGTDASAATCGGEALRMSDDRLMEWKLVRCLFSGSAGRKIKEKKQSP
jgi:hypothetical protein